MVGPGVPPDAEPVRWARDRGLPVWGEMELGARLARGPYLAVTGTNGKTTVTSMLEGCLREAGHDALACGNIGRPFPEAALEDHEVLVVEVSSFQLALQESFHPSISVLLNVAPDHLDWHGSFEDYVAAKRRDLRTAIRHRRPHRQSRRRRRRGDLGGRALRGPLVPRGRPGGRGGGLRR